MKGRHHMLIKVRWKIDVFSPERRSGRRELIHSQDEEGNSIIGNFISACCLAFNAAIGAPLAVTMTNWLGAAVVEHSNLFGNTNLDSAATDSNSGVCLGTGATPVTVDDFKLAAPIVHGAGVGQLLYGVEYQNVPTVGTNPRILQVVRAFSNGPAGAVVCSEAGLFMIRPGVYYMLERSVVSAFNIPALGAATATATLGVLV